MYSCYHTMPTSCRVVDCTSRQGRIAAVRRVNIDGSACQPSPVRRFCSLDFVSGRKNDNPTHPGYIRTLNMAGEDSTAVASTAEQSVSSVEQCSARKERKRRQFREAAQVASRIRRILYIRHSYSYANSESMRDPPTKLIILSEDGISLPSPEQKSTG